MTVNHSAAEQSRRFAGYEILSTLGQGGMGIVYEARDSALGRIVALKVLRDDLQSRPHLVSRFNREAQAIARLNHPNIVNVYSVGAEYGIPYIAMEYIDGAPLSMIMQRERRLGWFQALGIAAQIADALASAHDAQIIHRDIKPGNILVGNADQVYVTDFGIAKILTAETQLTADGSLLGTPQYMAPERCQNGDATAASDIYSLGVLTFQMISGRLPFEAATPVELVRKIVSEPPARLKQLAHDIPDDVDRLVAFMMEKKTKDRPVSARALCEYIARVRAGQPLDSHGQEVAEALASFRDTMATPMPRPAPHYINSTTTEERVGSNAPRRQQERKARRIALAAAGVALLVATLAGTGRWWQSARFPELPNASPQGADRWMSNDAVAEFIDEAPGVVLAKIALSDFHVNTLSGCGSTVLVQLVGAPASPRNRQCALLSFEPSRRIAAMDAAPMPRPPSGNGLAVHLLAGSDAASSPAILWFEDNASSRSGGGVIGWSAQTHNADNLLYRAPCGVAINAAARKPKDNCVALSVTTADGSSYLAERDLRSADLDALGPALSARGASIENVLYTRDGAEVVFVRDLGGSRRQIWVATTSVPGGANRQIADGALTVGPNAISPDGTLLAISELSAAGRSAVRVVRIKDGSLLAELGDGWMAGWCAGNRVIFTAADTKGRCQFWTAKCDASAPRAQVTFLEAGVAREFTVYDNGAAVAGSTGTAGAMVFVELAKAQG